MNIFSANKNVLPWIQIGMILSLFSKFLPKNIMFLEIVFSLTYHLFISHHSHVFGHSNLQLNVFTILQTL